MRARRWLASTALLFATTALALDKQGSAHGGQLVSTSRDFNVSGALMLGFAPYNPSYAARPDNTGLTLLRYGAHVDVDLLGPLLSIPLDVNFFSDRERPGLLVVAPSEFDVIAGVTSTFMAGPGALELGARVEHDRPVDEGVFTQTYVDARARSLYSVAALVPGLADTLREGDISGWATLGWFVVNPTSAARPDNTGLAALRYALHTELSTFSDRISLGLDGTFFTERENAALREELARVRGELKELTRIVEELQKRARKDKRQAHLFGRESEKKDKKKAGRKPGHEGAFRERPGHVDESVEARLDGCPCCGEPVFDVEELLQYVIDLPEIRMHVLQILTERGWCRRCRKHVRSTHPRQVSKAGGAAAVAMGPKASALVVELKTRQGVPYRDIAELFSRYLNFPVTHGALVQATVRLADKATPDSLNLVDEVRASALVHSDETGWRIARRSA